jgi:Phospholipase_D-nuclease N-terminal
VLDDASRALWVLVLVTAPVLGPIAFVVLRPGTRD